MPFTGLSERHYFPREAFFVPKPLPALSKKKLLAHSLHGFESKKCLETRQSMRQQLCFLQFSALAAPVAAAENPLQNGCATRSCPRTPTMRALVNSPVFRVLLTFSGGNSCTVPSISGASA